MLMKPRISASLVLYHSGTQALDTARCLAASTIPVDVHIVDNSPQDSTGSSCRAILPKAHYYRQTKNIGYGAGNNVAIRNITSSYHLVLNPDITFETDLLERMVAYMDAHRDISILTPRLFSPSGEEQFVPRMQPTVRRLLARSLASRFRLAERWRDEYTLRGYEMTGPLQVQFASGCFMLIRTTELYRLKGFDERFFLYHEDSDFSRRALIEGKIVYHPDFCVTHSWKRASAHDRQAFFCHLLSTLRYFAKWGWSW